MMSRCCGFGSQTNASSPKRETGDYRPLPPQPITAQPRSSPLRSPQEDFLPGCYLAFNVPPEWNVRAAKDHFQAKCNLQLNDDDIEFFRAERRVKVRLTKPLTSHTTGLEHARTLLDKSHLTVFYMEPSKQNEYLVKCDWMGDEWPPNPQQVMKLQQICSGIQRETRADCELINGRTIRIHSHDCLKTVEALQLLAAAEQEPFGSSHSQNVIKPHSALSIKNDKTSTNCKKEASNKIDNFAVQEFMWLYAEEFYRDALDAIRQKHKVSLKPCDRNGQYCVEVLGQDHRMTYDAAEEITTRVIPKIVQAEICEKVLQTGEVSPAALKEQYFQERSGNDGVMLVPGRDIIRVIGPEAPATKTVDSLRQLIEQSTTPPPSVLLGFVTRGIELKIEIGQGDLTKERVEAIVNPANTSLNHGGGAAKAIATAAGEALLRECQAIIQRNGELRVTQVVATTAGKLNNVGIKHVIHACGPRNDRKRPDVIPEQLVNTFYNALKCANDDLKVASVAIPAISSGIYGVDKNVVANMAFDALERFYKELVARQNNPAKFPAQSLTKIRFVNIDDPTTNVFLQVFEFRMSELSMSEQKNRDRRSSGGGSGKRKGSRSKSVERQNGSSGAEHAPYVSADYQAKSLPLADDQGYGMAHNGSKPFINEPPHSWTPGDKPSAIFQGQQGARTGQGQAALAGIHGETSKNLGGPGVGSPRYNGLSSPGVLGQASNSQQVTNFGASQGPQTSSPSQKTQIDDYTKEPQVRKPMMIDRSKEENNRSKRTNGSPSSTASPPVLGDCAICQDTLTSPKTLACGHRFCTDCIDQCFKLLQPKCPTCGKLFGAMKGNQPEGTITVSLDKTRRLPGYENYNTIVIEYNFPDGIQGPEHPNPGQRYSGTSRRAFLPCNDEGQEVSVLLQRAFAQRLIFTIGSSITTGRDNTVVWNDIHHKTDMRGQYGYPDDTYLKRVKAELEAKGIIPENGVALSSQTSEF